MTAIHVTGRRLAFVAFALIFGSETFGQDTGAPPIPISAFAPYASETFEYNSNIFALPNPAAALAANGNSRLGDETFKTAAGFTAGYKFLDRQEFFVQLEGKHLNFIHLDDLNHFEYFGLAGLDWKLLSELSGLFEVTQKKEMAPFAARQTNTQLALDIDRVVSLNARYQLAPEWRVEGAVDFHNEKAPVLLFPDYTLQETNAHFAVKYVGFSYFTYGLLASYATGKYVNAPLSDASYIERDLGLKMDYKASALSSFEGEIGHTQRDLGDEQGRISALTGKLGYTRSTGKTIFNIAFERATNSYLGAGGSELDTSGSLSLTYQATYKTGILFSVGDKEEKFIGQTLAQTFSVGRTDHTPTAVARLNWQVTRWVLISPYASYVRRNSNLDMYRYTGTIAGIELLVKKPVPPANGAR